MSDWRQLMAHSISRRHGPGGTNRARSGIARGTGSVSRADDLTAHVATRPGNTDLAAPFWPDTKTGGYSQEHAALTAPPEQGDPTTALPTTRALGSQARSTGA